MYDSSNVISGGDSPIRYFFDVQYSVLEARQQITETANRVVAGLKNTEAEFKELLTFGERVLQAVPDTKARFKEDEAHRLVVNYQQAEDGLLKLIQFFADMENSAVCDPKLDGRNEARVTAAFRRLIKLIKKVFETTQSIRWGIMENTEGIDEVASTESIDDLIARL